LSVVRLPEVDGTRRLLVMVGLERAVAAIESAFNSIGVEIGLLTTRLFALVPRNAGNERPMLVIQHEPAFLSLLLLVAGSVPRLLRTKPLPPTVDESEVVTREIELNLSYIRDKLEVADEIDARIVSTDAAVETAAWSFLDGRVGVSSVPSAMSAPIGPTTVVQRLGAAALAPAVAVVMGEVQ
jgi:hypothetical protein